MKSTTWAAVLLLACGGFLTAGAPSQYEQLTQQMLKTLDEITGVLKAVEGEEDAVAAKAKLRKSADTWKAARTKAANIQPPERAEKDRLAKIYKPKFEESLNKLLVEVRRVENIPRGRDALKEIASVLNKDEKQPMK